MSQQPLPTRAEQIAEYEQRKAEYDRAYTLWQQNGRLGPRPLRPVKPHIPGFLPLRTGGIES